jgi:hypothetical protein
MDSIDETSKLCIRINMGDKGHFYSKNHIKSTIQSINKEIVLFFRVTNWLSTVKTQKFLSSIF